MRRVLLDTDIFSECLRQNDPSVVAKARAYCSTVGRLIISAITVDEVAYGLHRRRPQRLAEFLGALDEAEVLVFDAEAAKLAGEIRAQIESKGTPVGKADPRIAAIALRNNLPLITGNTAHFQFMCDAGYPLELDNWRSPSPTY